MGTLSAERAKFWDWFRSNAGRLNRSFTETVTSDELIPLAEEAGKRLYNYDRRLSPLMGRAPDGVCEPIVTADGDADAFASVFELVTAAPEISGWRLIPLKPRGIGFTGFEAIELEGRRLPLETSRFSLIQEGDSYGLVVLVDTEGGATDELHSIMAKLLVESLIGEYDLAMRIAEFDVVSLTEFRRIAEHDGRPLVELTDAIPPSLPN